MQDKQGLRVKLMTLCLYGQTLGKWQYKTKVVKVCEALKRHKKVKMVSLGKMDEVEILKSPTGSDLLHWQKSEFLFNTLPKSFDPKFKIDPTAWTDLLVKIDSLGTIFKYLRNSKKSGSKSKTSLKTTSLIEKFRTLLEVAPTTISRCLIERGLGSIFKSTFGKTENFEILMVSFILHKLIVDQILISSSIWRQRNFYKEEGQVQGPLDLFISHSHSSPQLLPSWTISMRPKPSYPQPSGTIC